MMKVNLNDAKSELRLYRSKSDHLKRVRQGNNPVLCERQLVWTKRVKGGAVVPRKKAQVVLNSIDTITGQVLETYKTNALSSVNNRIDHYRALHPSVQVASV